MKLKVGARAPTFKVVDDQGEIKTLKDFSGKTVVLYFYPKDMTSGCTQQACDFQEALPVLKRKKAVVIGVSRDSVERHQKFKAKYHLDFTLLSDESTKMLESYGVWKEKSLYGRKFMGIERTTVVIGPDGKIQQIYPKVKVKGHVATVLSQI